MTTHPRFPKGERIPPGTKVVACPLPDGTQAVKVNVVLDGVQHYLVCSVEGVSTGDLITLDEVRERIRLGTA